jgi:hypothetical protein
MVSAEVSVPASRELLRLVSEKRPLVFDKARGNGQVWSMDFPIGGYMEVEKIRLTLMVHRK